MKMQAGRPEGSNAITRHGAEGVVVNGREHRHNVLVPWRGDVVPWAVVRVDGVPVGETPQDLKLRAGSHRLRVEHPALGSAELDLVVEPGLRQLWRPSLKR